MLSAETQVVLMVVSALMVRWLTMVSVSLPTHVPVSIAAKSINKGKLYLSSAIHGV